MDQGRSRVFRFGEYEVDARAGELRKNGTRVRLQEQPFQVLLALLQQPGQVLTREDLRAQVWPKDTFVDFDHALNTAIKKIRCALGDHAGVPRYVETIPKRGYRFIASLESVPEKALDAPETLMEAGEPAGNQKTYAGFWRIVAVFTLILIAAGSIAWWSVRSRAARSAEVTLALLPFQDLSSDSDPQYLCEGISEELTIQLARSRPRSLRLLDPWLAADGQKRSRGPMEPGRQLHADYMLVGSLRREGNRAHVVAQLIRSSDQSHVWSDEFDREVNDVFKFQTEVAAQIVSEVKPALAAVSHGESR